MQVSVLERSDNLGADLALVISRLSVPSSFDSLLCPLFSDDHRRDHGAKRFIFAIAGYANGLHPYTATVVDVVVDCGYLPQHNSSVPVYELLQRVCVDNNQFKFIAFAVDPLFPFLMGTTITAQPG